MEMVWIFAPGLGLLFALGLWCGVRLKREFRSRREPQVPTVAVVWGYYALHFLLVVVAAVDSTWPVVLPRAFSLLGGSMLMAVGGSIYLSAVVAFRSLKRLSGLDSTRLISVGIYRWSRNPQVVGWTLFLTGLALLSSSGMVLLLTLFFWGSFRIYLPLEEHLLTRLYGEAYRLYRKKTPRYFGAPKKDDTPSQKNGKGTQR